MSQPRNEYERDRSAWAVTMKTLKRMLCSIGPGHCANCESPCAYGVRYLAETTGQEPPRVWTSWLNYHAPEIDVGQIKQIDTNAGTQAMREMFGVYGKGGYRV